MRLLLLWCSFQLY